MQGMRFLLLNEQGQPVNNGVITSQVTQERFMCTFMRPPQVSRLCHVDEIGTWNLFPNDEALNNFILAIQAETGQPTQPVEPPPEGEPPGGKKKIIKKVAKKKAPSKKKRSAKS